MAKEKMTYKDVDYKLKYIGPDKPDIKHGRVYRCIREWYGEDGKLDSYRVIDETGEGYIYFPKNFEKAE